MRHSQSSLCLLTDSFRSQLWIFLDCPLKLLRIWKAWPLSMHFCLLCRMSGHYIRTVWASHWDCEFLWSGTPFLSLCLLWGSEGRNLVGLICGTVVRTSYYSLSHFAQSFLNCEACYLSWWVAWGSSELQCSMWLNHSGDLQSCIAIPEQGKLLLSHVAWVDQSKFLAVTTIPTLRSWDFRAWWAHSVQVPLHLECQEAWDSSPCCLTSSSHMPRNVQSGCLKHVFPEAACTWRCLKGFKKYLLFPWQL